MKIEMGGGIRTTEDVERVLNIGVDRVIVGTRAIQEPKWLVEVSERFPDRIALGLDAQGKMLAVQGWTKAARELQTWQDLGDISLEEWARHKLQQLLVAEAKPAAIIYTDTTRDGMMTGPNFEATTAMVNAASPFPVIASGGVTTVEDVRRVKAVGAAGAIIGRALYEGTLTIEAALEAAREV
jgi:phosphoribosylformimino-5-aminoimidazole carboxamide ribotide isomerase